MNRPRVGLIGCGHIAEFHAPALEAAGFELTAVASRPGSERVHAFANKYGISAVFGRPQDLLRAREQWDALLIAVSVEPTLELLCEALETGAPVLVEKPVSFRSLDLKPLLNDSHPVIVGYNRRFYRTVLYAREEASCELPFMARMNLPESVAVPDTIADNTVYLKNFFSNSVHGLDMLRFVFGNITLDHLQRLHDRQGRIHGLAAMFSSESGGVIQFSAKWKNPDNFSLTLDMTDHRLALRPFELATIYEGMEVVDPTPDMPIRTYMPKVIGKVELDAHDRLFKPGFLAQAQAFFDLVNGRFPDNAARLDDAYSALVLAEQLAGEYIT